MTIQLRRDQLESRLRQNTANGPELAGGDIDAQWEMAESCGDETVCGSMMTPDQNVVDEYGDAFGIGYDDGELLRFGEKERERDLHRWELDPASADDWGSRPLLPPHVPLRRLAQHPVLRGIDAIGEEWFDESGGFFGLYDE